MHGICTNLNFFLQCILGGNNCLCVCVSENVVKFISNRKFMSDSETTETVATNTADY